MTVDLLEDVYDDLKDDDKLKKIKVKLKKEYKDEEFSRVYLDALVQECIKIQPLNKNELSTLASTRANILRSYLVEKKSIESSRINILKIDSVKEHDEKYSKTKLEIVVE